MKNIQNVYEQVDSNKRKSAFLILGFILFIAAFGYFFTYLYNDNGGYLVFALLFSGGTSIVSFYNSDKIALSLARAQKAPPAAYPRLHAAVGNIAKVASVPKPGVYVIPSAAMNAFATGRDPQHAAVAVTQGLYDNLSRTELEGVIAHEIAHIKNYDTRLMTLVAILVGSIAIIMDWSFRFSMGGGRRSRREGGGILMIIGILLIILAPLVATIIKLAISRRREFFADAQGVKFTRQPSGLIEALKKISQSQPLEVASPATAHMYIANPLKGRQGGQWLANLFATHPPVQERIRALQGEKV